MRRLLVPLAILSLALTACGQSLVQSEAIALANPTLVPTVVDSVTDIPSLTQALRAAGATVAAEGRVSVAFLQVDGTLLSLGEERVQVYEYPTAANARADASRFSRDGAWVNSDIGATFVNWFATPHLFHASRLIAIYVGDHAPTLSLLEGVFGAPFAGGANPYRASAVPAAS